jgi:CRP-like cAMP-binding protein
MGDASRIHGIVESTAMFTVNRALEALSEADAYVLRPHLKLVHLQPGTVLFNTCERVSAVYFPVDAIISLVVALTTGEAVEAAMIGRDGLVGGGAALDGGFSISRGIVQLGGEARVCDANTFKGVGVRSEGVRDLVMRHERAIFVQAQQSAACMATHDISARLARWLLRARDLAGSDTLPFTQEHLAEMLGVRRTSVTTAAHALQESGMVSYQRGKIVIKHVPGLQKTACECYATVNARYAMLFENRTAAEAG